MKAFAGSQHEKGVGQMKKRILIVSGFVVDTYSEIEKSYVELSEYIEKNSNNLEVIWLIPDISWKDNRFRYKYNKEKLSEPLFVSKLKEKNIKTIRGNISKYNFIANFFLLKSIIRENNISAVYTHYGHERFYTTLIAKMAHKITIWNEHWPSLTTKFCKLKRVFYVKLVDHFICVSEDIKNTLPINKNRVVVNNAIKSVDYESTIDQKAKLKEKLGIPVDKKVVLMVAGFKEQKRPMLAAEICKGVLQDIQNVCFVFLGDGPLMDAFRKQINGIRGSESIILKGHVQNVSDYYNIADVSMLTSAYEGLPYAMLESLNYSLPVICFDVKGVKDVVIPDYNGYLITDNDVQMFVIKLKHLLKNEFLRKELGENSKRMVKTKFNRDKWLEDMTSILTGIVS